MSDIEAEHDASPPVITRTDGQRRERSRIQFPYEDLAAAESVAKAVHDRYGGRADREQIAAALETTVTSGSFRTKLSAAQMFGLVVPSRGGLETTELGVAVLDDASAPAARAQAFLKVPLYAALYDRFRGGTLPGDAGLEAAIRELGVPPKQSLTARQALQRSADRAGYFHQGRGRLVPPPVARVEEPQREEEKQGDRREEEPGMQAHPLLAGLFKELPPREQGYSQTDRDNFKAALDAILTIVYGPVPHAANPGDGQSDDSRADVVTPADGGNTDPPF